MENTETNGTGQDAQKTRNLIEGMLRSVNRPGMDKVIKYLADSDFYTAPASAVFQFHNCCDGGLADHSWKVYQMMCELNSYIPPEKQFHPESLVIVGLLHDVCKIGIYKPNILATKKRSDEKPWKFEDPFSLGHGEKSLAILLGLGLEMSPQEQNGCRWHMCPFDNVPYSKSSSSWGNLAVLCFLADYFSSKFLEFIQEAQK